jgi:hypothetical protein
MSRLTLTQLGTYVFRRAELMQQINQRDLEPPKKNPVPS